MAGDRSQTLVTSDWLADHLDDESLVILDGSFSLPGAAMTAAESYAERHIPGAVFFDIDRIADTQNASPHMLPSPQVFQQLVGELGLSNDDAVIVYDSAGMMSAGRVWWMLRVFGHEKVAVLNGGLRKWLADGRPVTTQVSHRARRRYRAEYNERLVRTKQQLLANLATHVEQIIDARPRARFLGAEDEPRPGLRRGHIPSSLNLPFSSLSDDETGEMKAPEAIKALFAEAGLDLSRPVVATCGSGVTACALAFGLHLIGKSDVAIYDGSWAEWGAPTDAPVEAPPY